MDKQTIEAALAGLDPNKDEDWNDNGSPSVAAVQRVAQNSEIRAAHIKEHAPDFERPAHTSGGSSDKNTQAAARDTQPPQPPEVAETEGMSVFDRKQKAKQAEVEDHPNYVKNVRMMTIAKGVYGGGVRSTGEVFTFTGIKGSWHRPATKDECKGYDKWLRDQQ
ncbi:hypothetical protein [uncultured Paraglaciecola sp.]|uniref:hypothetical protein n=1 Tax=uncultured Paraglaciecola sp. TaxID=1765024 RepID=UPI00261ADA33|nr:hypothetical protein [uncultured Paraglaciecola sp.]